MRDARPQVLRRLLRLRQVPFLESVELDELAMVAENAVERTIPAGAIVAATGSRVHEIVLVIDGQLETRPPVPCGPHHLHGALEVLSARPALRTTFASRETKVLQLRGVDFRDLLEDNFGLLVATLRGVASRLIMTDPPAFPSTNMVSHSKQLGLVERLILLRQQVPFASTGLPALAGLAHASEEIELAPGSVLVRAGELATAAFVLLDGTAVASHAASTETLYAGAAIGQLEVLAGTQHNATIETTTSARALRTTATAVLDMLEDHTDVGLTILGALANQLLDGPSAARE